MQRTIVKIDTHDMDGCINGKAVYMLFVSKGVRLKPRSDWPDSAAEYLFKLLAEDIEKPCTVLNDVMGNRLVISQQQPVLLLPPPSALPHSTSV